MRSAHKNVKSYAIQTELVSECTEEGTRLSTAARVATERYLKAVKDWEKHCPISLKLRRDIDNVPQPK